jgi:xylulose-5-phosphate/fructose-6-phosphate phosphoketolase
MAVLNGLDRFHLAIDALRRAPRMHAQADNAVTIFEHKLALHRAFILENDEDMPEIQNWQFSAA